MKIIQKKRVLESVNEGYHAIQIYKKSNILNVELIGRDLLLMRKFLSVRMNLDHSVVNNDSFNELFNFLAKITEKEENKKFEIDS